MAHLVSRAWLDLDALRALRDCPLLALELPGLAQVDVSWIAVVCAHTELVRLDLRHSRRHCSRLHACPRA